MVFKSENKSVEGGKIDGNDFVFGGKIKISFKLCRYYERFVHPNAKQNKVLITILWISLFVKS